MIIVTSEKNLPFVQAFLAERFPDVPSIVIVHEEDDTKVEITASEVASSNDALVEKLNQVLDIGRFVKPAKQMILELRMLTLHKVPVVTPDLLKKEVPPWKRNRRGRDQFSRRSQIDHAAARQYHRRHR